MSLLSRLANVFRGSRIDRDIEEELQSHLDEAMEHGRAPSEAKYAFGSRLRAHEAVRDAVVMTWLESIFRDARFGLRQLGKRKTTTAAAILSLGLGMGACTAAFRLIDALLLKPLPVANPETLYALGSEARINGQTIVRYSFDYPGFRQMRAAVPKEASLMAISYPQRINLTYSTDEAMERVYLQYVSGWTFAEFGLRPALGRLFTEGDDLEPGARPFVVISHDYWAKRFDKDPRVLGRKFRTGNQLFEIVGVAPEGYTGTERGTFIDVFAPTMMYTREALSSSNWNWFTPWVRVKPGFTLADVRPKLQAALLAHRQEKFKSLPPGTPKNRQKEFLTAPMVLMPAGTGVSDLQRTYSRALITLGLLVVLVLLIACVNVANLMSAQAAARSREMALRVSIGAGRSRLIQLVLVEGAWIALAASALSVAFAWWAAPFVVSMINPVDAPVRLALPTDTRVTCFGALMTLVVIALFGLIPALRASYVRPSAALKGGEEPHSRHRIMGALIGAQVAFCVVVQLVAGLFVSTFERLVNQPLGFSPHGVLVLGSVMPGGQDRTLWYQVADHLRSVSGVQSAAVMGFALMSGTGWNGNVWANGHSPEEYPETWFLAVSPTWMDTMKIPLLEGRQIRPDDLYPRVAIVNRTFAKRYFENQSPVGKTLDVNVGRNRATVEIIGVAADARYTGMREPIDATLYVPLRSTNEQGASPFQNGATFVVRTNQSNSMSLAGVFRQEIQRAHAGLRVANIQTQDELDDSQTVRERLLARLSVFFGGLALLLAGLGLYGVLSYAVTQRLREFGIRIALGANAPHIAGRVAFPLSAIIAAGTAIGLVLGVSAEHFFRTILFGVKATDAGMLLWAVSAIGAATALSAVPAVLRALRVDAATLLRTD